MTGFTDWTYDDVRARIIEAADTLTMCAPDRGPDFSGAIGEIVRVAAESYGYNAAVYRRVPSAGALSRMEETWSWINGYLNEKDRRLLYTYGFIMTRKGLTLARWCDRNGWVKRTFERAVNRCCQRIADELNRKHSIRLTMAVDDVSHYRAEPVPSEVASTNCVQRTPNAVRMFDRAELRHDSSPEAAKTLGRHLAAINRHRQNQAKRQKVAA